MCCEVVLCCGIVGWRETRRSGKSHRAPAVAALADDNLAKAQVAGLQLNRLHTPIAWRRGVLHWTADAKVPELHESNARLTDLLAKC